MKVGDLVKRGDVLGSNWIGLIVDENIGKFNGNKMVKVMLADGTIVTRSETSLEVVCK
tara:strand:+ start:86 stop:259 length:174 start_codon:yes stop_codon:yes gene_type:complete